MHDDPEQTLREFLTALNQWQRNAYLRWRLDNYEFTGNVIRAAAQERSPQQLIDDWQQISSTFLLPECLYSEHPPETLTNPPLFDSAEPQAFSRVKGSNANSLTFEVTGGLNNQYRFVLARNTAGGWSIQQILSQAYDDKEPWKQLELL